MAMVNSTMMELGTAAPDFALPDTEGRTVRISYYKGKPTVVAFICNHCPFVKHLADELAAFARQVQSRGVRILAINSNDAQAYPADSPENMKEEARVRGYSFPYLYDQTQEVAKAYRAACTPDFFLFDAEHKLVYRGQFDDTRPKRITSGVYDHAHKPTGADLRRAIDAVLAGTPVPDKQHPSAGCNIKWKPGNEPAYFQV